jgi:hypothetical protein
MLQRLDAIESELSGVMQSLRTGSGRINADLQLLATNLEDVRQAVSPRSRFEAEAAPSTPPAPAVETVPEGPDEIGERIEVEVEEYEIAVVESEPAAAGAPTSGSDDTEGARLIALNMALNGTPREETDRYLAENFELNDRSALLDEVYASVGG